MLRSRQPVRGASEKQRRDNLTPPSHITKDPGTQEEAADTGLQGERRTNFSIPVPPLITNPNPPQPTTGLPPPEVGAEIFYDGPP